LIRYPFFLYQFNPTFRKLKPNLFEGIVPAGNIYGDGKMTRQHQTSQLLLACCVLIGMLIPACGRADNTDPAKALTISAKLNKQNYIWGEPIVVTVTITNTGRQTISQRWFGTGGSFCCKVLDASGKGIPTVTAFSFIEQTYSDWNYALPSAKSISTSFDLLRGDPIDQNGTFPKLAIYHPRKGIGYATKTGAYRSIFSYYLQDDSSGSPRLKLQDATVSFSIRSPNNEEKEALKLFEINYMFSSARDEKITNAIGNFNKIYTQYFNTPYAPYALYYCGRLLQYRGANASALSKYATLLEHYPQFPLMEDLLYYQALALRDAKQPARAHIAAQYLHDHYKNHLVSPGVPMPRAKGNGMIPGSRIINFAKEMGVKTEEE
jgi:hypothetical protein